MSTWNSGNDLLKECATAIKGAEGRKERPVDKERKQKQGTEHKELAGGDHT